MISSFENAAGDPLVGLGSYGGMKTSQEFELVRNVYRGFIRVSGLVKAKRGLGDM